jgi:hypothetical protein
LLVSKHQPLDLAHRQVQTLSRKARLEHTVDHRLNDLEPVQLAHRHGDLSVAAIAASGAAGSTPGKLRPPESGHF